MNAAENQKSKDALSKLSEPMTQWQAYILMGLIMIAVLTFFWARSTNVMASTAALRTSCQTEYLAGVYAMHDPSVKPWTDYLTGGRTPHETLQRPQCKKALNYMDNLEATN